MLGFLNNSALAHPDYPRLSANQSSSEDYEIIRLVDGPIDALYQVKSTNQFIAQTGSNLWKINATGEVIDHFDTDHLYTSGIIFEKDGFIDWVFTGEKQKKPFSKIVDAAKYSSQELMEAFSEADIIEFIDDREQGYAYLYHQGEAWVIDISSQRDKIDNLIYSNYDIRNQYNIRREKTVISANRFDKFIKKPDVFSFIPSSLWPSHATIKGYKKITFHKQHSIAGTLLDNTLLAIFMPNKRFAKFGYEVGYSHVELEVQNQTLKFSILSSDEYTTEKTHSINWLEPEPSDMNTLKFMAVNYRRENLAELNEHKLLPYYEKDLGLYVLRKKIPHNQSATNALLLSYSGIHSYQPIWGNLKFSQPDLHPLYYWFRQTRPVPSSVFDKQYFRPGRNDNIVSPIIKAAPKSLTLHLTDFKPHRNFRLVLNGRDAWFLAPEYAQVIVNVEFDQAELTEARQQLQGKNEAPASIQLNLHMEEKSYGAELKIHLQNADKKIPLTRIGFDYQEVDYTPKSPHPVSDKNSLALFQAYEASLLNFKPETFLNALQTLLNKNEIENLSSPVSYYFASLSLQFNINKKLEESTQLMNFYFNNIHSLIGYTHSNDLKNRNLIVFATQGIYVAAHTQKSALANEVVNAFAGENFDLKQEKNRTFLFNLACYYATNHNKSKMLTVITRAIALGRDPQSFLTDQDFKAYWLDPDFVHALE